LFTPTKVDKLGRSVHFFSDGIVSDAAERRCAAENNIVRKEVAAGRHSVFHIIT